jgi:single-strand DNA-binding protein
MRDWKDKNGNNRRAAEIQVDNIYFGDSKPQDNGSYSGYAAQVGKFNSAPQFAEVDDEEGVPF